MHGDTDENLKKDRSAARGPSEHPEHGAHGDHGELRPERTFPSRLLGLVLQGLAVLGGVLLAFGIDAAWDNRSAAIAERALLASLRAELISNRALIENSIETHRYHAAVGRALLGADPAIPRDSLASLVARSTYWRSSDLQVGAINSAIQGGALEQIRSRELRDLIASWPAEFADVVENETMESSLVREDQFRLIGEYVDVADLAAYTGAWDTGLDAWEPPAAEALLRLVEDGRFRTVVFQRVINDQLMLAEFDRLLETATTILTLLGDEIGS